MLTIPLRTDLAHYEFQIELEGESFVFELRWNERDGAWALSISDADGNPLLSGRRVVLGTPLLFRKRAVSPTLPPGELIAEDTSGTGIEPGIGDLGGRVQLRYLLASEL